MKIYKQAFTLVELIVVITILAILGTIAFLSFQGYSQSARDSKRTSDVNNIQTSLELFVLQTGKYPHPDNYESVTYSGGSVVVWQQGTIGDTVFTQLGRNLSQKPVDPLFQNEYTYSTTQNRKEYEIMSLYEGDMVHNNYVQQTYANSVTVKISGTYNGLYVKTGNYIIPTPSIITSLDPTSLDFNNVTIESQVINGGTNIPDMGIANINQSTGSLSFATFEVYNGVLDVDSSQSEWVGAFDVIANTYSGSTLISTNIVQNLLLNSTDEQKEAFTKTIVLPSKYATSSNTPIAPVEPVDLITSADCASAGWMWVGDVDDVYIGSTQGNGFCISPRFGDWQTNGTDLHDGLGSLSWNGWGHDSSVDMNGWNTTGIGDSGNPYPAYGQTRILDSQVSYACKTLGTANSDFDTDDSIVGRMKWLVTSGNSYTGALSIDWITGINPVNGHAVPALYIADCIDGVKDLGTTMNYSHIDNSIEEITYAEYSLDEASDTDQPALSNTTFQNRQKYLTAWTQKSGSHLPSSFSFITNGYASADDSDGDYLTGTGVGEYQAACEANLLTDASDNTDNEWIWSAAVGRPSGSYWGRVGRLIGSYGCSDQAHGNTSYRRGNQSARFVVRP